MSRLLAAAALAAATLLARPAAAEAPPPAPGDQRHDGVYLHFQAGPAYLVSGQDESVLRGPGFGLHLAIGGSSSENLVFFGEYLVHQARGPTAETGGRERETDDDVTLAYSHLGPGLTYYFPESNVFVTSSLGLATLTYAEGFLSAKLEGLGVHLGLGREWWVGEQWGLGVAADLVIGHVAHETEDLLEGDGPTTASLGLTFSATYQ